VVKHGATREVVAGWVKKYLATEIERTSEVPPGTGEEGPPPKEIERSLPQCSFCGSKTKQLLTLFACPLCKEVIERQIAEEKKSQGG